MDEKPFSDLFFMVVKTVKRESHRWLLGFRVSFFVDATARQSNSSCINLYNPIARDRATGDILRAIFRHQRHL